MLQGLSRVCKPRRQAESGLQISSVGPDSVLVFLRRLIVQKKSGLWLLSKHMKFYDQWSKILLVGDQVKLRGCHPFLVGRNLLHSLPVLFSQAEIMHLPVQPMLAFLFVTPVKRNAENIWK